jgi:zinc transport system substrate-binding protein
MKQKRLLFILMVLLGSITVFQSCQQSERAASNTVSVSIDPLKYFVDQLTGNALDVNVMVPQGASHGTYAPTASQMQKLSDSKIYIRIGYLGYERAFISKLKELNSNMTELNLSDHVELIRGEPIVHGDHVHEGGVDPHIWMSPQVMLKALPVIKKTLTEAYPELTDTIAARYSILEGEIMQLDREMQDVTADLSVKRFMIFHPALTYLARDYDMEQVPIEFEGKEPSPARLKNLIRDNRASNIPVIFIQQEYDVNNARLVATETGAEVVTINPMAYNWADEIKNLMAVFNEHLK